MKERLHVKGMESEQFNLKFGKDAIEVCQQLDLLCPKA